MTLPAAALLAGCGGAGSGTPTPSTSFAGSQATTVTYCHDGGTAQTLDVYQPSGGGPSAHPLLIVVHGGSWAFGSSRLADQNPLTQDVVAGVLARGFVVASINYRLAPRDPWPAQIIDTRCAIRYLRATASRWNLDTRRFMGLGNSAGAQLVSLAALSDGQVPQWDSPEFAGQSTALAAVVDLWGPVDLTATGWSQEALAIGRAVFQVDLGGPGAVLTPASPVSYIHAGAPPFEIIQGLSDTLVPPAQATELRDRLVAAGDAATLVDVANAAHELRPVGGIISPGIDVLSRDVLSFLAATATATPPG